MFNGFSTALVAVPPPLQQLYVKRVGSVIFIEKGRGCTATDADIADLTQLIPSHFSIVVESKGLTEGMRVESVRSNSLSGKVSHDTRVVRGSVPEQVIGEEAGLKMNLWPLSQHDVGVHMDIALGRIWVRENAKDQRVANLFAYTCLFGVAGTAAVPVLSPLTFQPC